MQFTDDHWVLEYSRRQDCYHIQTVRQMVANNLENHRYGVHPDYVPLAIFPTADEAGRFKGRLTGARGGDEDG